MLTFGKHKGQRMNEVPGDYLRWLTEEQPHQLQPGQLEEARKVLKQRDVLRRAVPFEKAMVQKEEERFRATRATQRAVEKDPVLARTVAEKAARQPKTLDPEYFGQDAKPKR